MRSLYLFVVYMAILGLGIGVPFVLTLGYVWVDIFRPGNVSYSLLKSLPVAFIMGAGAIGGYFLLDRRSPPRLSMIMVLSAVFAGWVTMTTLWAVVPDPAWQKWDWAFKSIVFSVFIPFAIRSRNHIEGYVQVFVFSLMGNTFPFGIKSMFFQGGYGDFLGLMNRNFFLGQGETLATACALCVPLILFLLSHSRIVPLNRVTKAIYYGLIVLCLATAIGTHERTALVGLGVLAMVQWTKTCRKGLYLGLCAIVGLVIVISAPPEWYKRMSTLSNPTADPSAVVRLHVWKWTLDYVTAHPLGGGFEAYFINEIEVPIPQADSETPEVKIQHGRAFHSTYFEVLGEHGWLGLGLFLSIVILTFRTLRQTVRMCRGKPHLAWCADFANAVQTSLLVILACGVFTSLGFQPFLYYLFALSVCAREYVRRVQAEEVKPVPMPAPVPAWRGQGL